MTQAIAVVTFVFLLAPSFVLAQTPPNAPAQEAMDQAPLPPAPPTTEASGNVPPMPVDQFDVPPSESPSQAAKNLLSGIIEDYSYEATGKRDPFLPYSVAPKQAIASAEGPVFPLQKFDLDQLKLIGIIWEIRSPKAMILDPSGKGYIVRTNERLGRNNGYIAKIREGELVVVESFTGGDGKTSYQTKLVKLVQE